MMHVRPSAPVQSELSVDIDRGRLAMARTRGALARSAVLLIHGFAQNRHAWDLPSRSLSRHLAECGHDVFNLELRGHGRSRELGAPPAERFDDHVDIDVPAALARIQQEGHRQVFLLGHSLGGAIAYAVAASHARHVAGVVTFSGVYRWGNAGRWLSRMLRIVRTGATTGRWLGMRGPSVRLDVLGRWYAQHYAQNRNDRLPVPIQGWYPGSIEPELLDEWLRLSLDRQSGAVLSLMTRWAKGGDLRSSRGDDYAAGWRRCRVPVLVIAADRDRLAHPLEDVKPAYDQSSATDRTFRCFGRDNDDRPFGHVDLIFGRHAPAVVWPYVTSWLHKRQGATNV